MNDAPDIHDGSKLEERSNGNANGKYRLTLLVQQNGERRNKPFLAENIERINGPKA